MKKQFTMTEGDKKLYWDGKKNQPVELVEKLHGGWLIRLSNGMQVGPVKEDPAILR